MSERSKRIYKAITASGLSYGELSKLTGVPKSALQRYATGETEKVPIDRMEAIANATGTTTTYLMGWEDSLDRGSKGSEEGKILAKITKDKDAQRLLEYYFRLDGVNKKMALGAIEALAKSTEE